MTIQYIEREAVSFIDKIATLMQRLRQKYPNSLETPSEQLWKRYL